MARYYVKATSTLYFEIGVDAESEEEAVKKVSNGEFDPKDVSEQGQYRWEFHGAYCDDIDDDLDSF